jgi:hypothetical protein
MLAGFIRSLPKNSRYYFNTSLEQSILTERARRMRRARSRTGALRDDSPFSSQPSRVHRPPTRVASKTQGAEKHRRTQGREVHPGTQGWQRSCQDARPASRGKILTASLLTQASQASPGKSRLRRGQFRLRVFLAEEKMYRERARRDSRSAREKKRIDNLDRRRSTSSEVVVESIKIRHELV